MLELRVIFRSLPEFDQASVDRNGYAHLPHELVATGARQLSLFLRGESDDISPEHVDWAIDEIAYTTDRTEFLPRAIGVLSLAQLCMYVVNTKHSRGSPTVEQVCNDLAIASTYWTGEAVQTAERVLAWVAAALSCASQSELGAIAVARDVMLCVERIHGARHSANTTRDELREIRGSAETRFKLLDEDDLDECK